MLDCLVLGRFHRFFFSEINLNFPSMVNNSGFGTKILCKISSYRNRTHQCEWVGITIKQCVWKSMVESECESNVKQIFKGDGP